MSNSKEGELPSKPSIRGTDSWLKRIVAGFSLHRSWLNPRPMYMGFDVDDMALGIGLLVLRTFAVSIIPPALHARSVTCHRRYMMSAIGDVVK